MATIDNSILVSPVVSRYQADRGFSAQETVARKAASVEDAATFSALMKSHDVQNVAQLSPASKSPAPSVIEKIAATQTADLRDIFRSTRELLAATPNMSMQELAAAGMDLTLKVQVTSTQFTIASSVAKASNSGFQTLMKNQ